MESEQDSNSSQSNDDSSELSEYNSSDSLSDDETAAVDYATNETPAASVSSAEIKREERLERLLKQIETYKHRIEFGTSKINSNKPAVVISGQPKRTVRATVEDLDESDIDDSQSSEEQTVFRFEESPDYIKNGKMRGYQIDGLNWLITLYHNDINGILADEMGLGKTIQTIALLGYLKHYCEIDGPHLVIAPLSTLQNWVDEFEKWCPSLKSFYILATKGNHEDVIKNVLRKQNKWNVCIVSYEGADKFNFQLKRIKWKYIVIDEAHRIKNEKTILSKTVRSFKSSNRLLLTGTPLQNNLHELWSLLNFLLPDLFESSKDFDEWFDTNKCLQDPSIASRLRNVLKPFLLRRVKSEVERGLLAKKEIKIFVKLTKLQREWYRKVLLKYMQVFTAQGEAKWQTLNALFIQCRKVTNHPYLFPGAEDGPPYVEGEHIVTSCGKMIVLDKLLKYLKENGHRVLLFCQWTQAMNVIEDYLVMRGYSFRRLDGSTDIHDRVKYMKEFNTPNSDIFIFMLSTRAGGLGINLYTADTVILYESDWNPQIDLQAIDRAHRIGQTKQVRVFRLITEGTVDEKLVERSMIKLRLDRMVMQNQNKQLTGGLEMNAAFLLNSVRFGTKDLFEKGDNDYQSQDEQELYDDIADIIKRSEERTEEEIKKLNEMDEEKLRQYTLESHSKSSTVFDFENLDYRALQQKVHAETLILNDLDDDRVLTRSRLRNLAFPSSVIVIDDEEDTKIPVKPEDEDPTFDPFQNDENISNNNVPPTDEKNQQVIKKEPRLEPSESNFSVSGMMSNVVVVTKSEIDLKNREKRPLEENSQNEANKKMKQNATYLVRF